MLFSHTQGCLECTCKLGRKFWFFSILSWFWFILNGFILLFNFCFQPICVWDPEIQVLAKRVKQSFHTKFGPEFWNLKTMPNLYFLEIRFFGDRFCLLRRFRPGPISQCFIYRKIWSQWVLVGPTMLKSCDHENINLRAPDEDDEEDKIDHRKI